MTQDTPCTELYRTFIGEKRTDYYLEQFAAFDSRGGGFYTSWNWAALFLGPFWALYRKIYVVVLLLLIPFFSFMIVSVVAFANSFWGVSSVNNTGRIFILIFTPCVITFAIYANTLYYRRARRIIAKSKARIEDAQDLHLYLQSTGGENFREATVLGIFLGLIVLVVGLNVFTDEGMKSYRIRSRVSEASSLSTAARAAVDVAYKEARTLGALPSQADSPPASYASKYVRSVSVDRNGVISVSLTDHDNLGPVANGTVTYTPRVQGNQLVWVSACSFAARWCPVR